MSRHVFYTQYKRKPVYVLISWQQGQQRYSMVVDRINIGDSAPLYTTFLDQGQSLEPLLRTLKTAFNIVLPEEMLSEIVQDRLQQVGHKDITHTLLRNGIYQRTEGIDLKAGV